MHFVDIGNIHDIFITMYVLVQESVLKFSISLQKL